jgi:hypothetical protein
MNKQSLTKWFLLLLVGTAFTVQPVVAQEEEEEEQQEVEETQEVVEEQTMNQGQLAIILARRLGLVIGTPLTASPAAAILALEQVGVSPARGWSAEEPVTLGDMASVINVLLGNDVDETAEDPETAAVDMAVASGVDFSSIASALNSAGIISAGERESLTPAAQTFNDPLSRVPPGRPIDTFEQNLNDTVPFDPPGLPALTPN